MGLANHQQSLFPALHPSTPLRVDLPTQCSGSNFTICRGENERPLAHIPDPVLSRNRSHFLKKKVAESQQISPLFGFYACEFRLALIARFRSLKRRELASNYCEAMLETVSPALQEI